MPTTKRRHAARCGPRCRAAAVTVNERMLLAAGKAEIIRLIDAETVVAAAYPSAQVVTLSTSGIWPPPGAWVPSPSGGTLPGDREEITADAGPRRTT